MKIDVKKVVSLLNYKVLKWANLNIKQIPK